MTLTNLLKRSVNAPFGSKVSQLVDYLKMRSPQEKILLVV